MLIGAHRYKDIKIWYDDYVEKWKCELGGREVGKEMLKGVRDRIDRFLKAEKKFDRFNAIYLGSGWGGKDQYSVVVITSQTDDGNYWTTKDGKRSKETPSQLAMDTPENQALVEEIKTLEAKEVVIINTIKRILDSIIPLPDITPHPPA